MKKQNRTQRVCNKRRINEDAVPIPPWWYTGREVIDLDDDDWREVTPEEDTIPA